MSLPSAIAAGFRTALRRPALVGSEIAWRWTFAVAVWALLFGTFVAYLHSLTVTTTDWVLLRSKVPTFVLAGLRDIFAGSSPRLWRAAAVLCPAISLLWVFAASFGRWAGVRALLEDSRGSFWTVAALHFLRSAAALAAWIGYFGALLASGFVAGGGYQDRPGLFLLMFLAFAIVIAIVHGRVRSCLAMANVFAVRDGSDAFASVAAAFDAQREHRGSFLALAATMWAIRLFCIVSATVAVFLLLGVLPYVSWKPVAVAIGIIAMAYFAIVDFLFAVRQAACVDILRNDSQPDAAPGIAPASLPSLPTTGDLRVTPDPQEPTS